MQYNESLLRSFFCTQLSVKLSSNLRTLKCGKYFDAQHQHLRCSAITPPPFHSHSYGTPVHYSIDMYISKQLSISVSACITLSRYANACTYDQSNGRQTHESLSHSKRLATINATKKTVRNLIIKFDWLAIL